MHRRRGARDATTTDPATDSTVDTLLHQTDPLDETEQEAVVKALREQTEQQQARGGAVLAALNATLAVLFSWLALEQALYPYQQMHTGELRTVVEGWVVGPGFVLLVQAGGLWAASAASAAVAMAPRQRRQQQQDETTFLLRLAAASSALMGLIYWFLAIAQHARKHPSLGIPWELAWLPLAPCLLAGVSEVARSAFAATAAEVDALAGLRYDHKRV